MKKLTPTQEEILAVLAEHSQGGPAPVNLISDWLEMQFGGRSERTVRSALEGLYKLEYVNGRSAWSITREGRKIYKQVLAAMEAKWAKEAK